MDILACLAAIAFGAVLLCIGVLAKSDSRSISSLFFGCALCLSSFGWLLVRAADPFLPR